MRLLLMRRLVKCYDRRNLDATYCKTFHYIAINNKKTQKKIEENQIKSLPTDNNWKHTLKNESFVCDSERGTATTTATTADQHIHRWSSANLTFIFFSLKSKNFFPLFNAFLQSSTHHWIISSSREVLPIGNLIIRFVNNFFYINFFDTRVIVASDVDDNFFYAIWKLNQPRCSRSTTSRWLW